MKTILLIVLIITAGIELGEAAIDSLQQNNTRISEEHSQSTDYAEGSERIKLNYYTGFSRSLATN